MADQRITFKKPPSLDRVMTWVGRLARHEHFNETMTGEEAQTAAAVFFAANWALKRDRLSKSWAGNRHVAAKCGELFERVSNDPSFTRANFQIEVDIEFC